MNETRLNRVEHPVLYKMSSTGALQLWEISVEGSTICTKWGQVGGAVQETRDVIAEGKNLGKKNATTAAEQASAEALARWEKALKSKKYVRSEAEARSGAADERVLGGVDVMLAHRFDEHGDRVVYPCLVQPKFDGHRATVVVGPDGCPTMWSRTRKPILSMPHVLLEVAKLGLPPGTALDGELYVHDYRDRFEALTSMIRAAEPREGAEVVQYHVYDLASSMGTQEVRAAELESMIGSPAASRSPVLVPVLTEVAEDEDDLLAHFQRFLALGYEGAMARCLSGKYVGKRSYDLLKIKEFVDAEFMVVGVESGRGKMSGLAIFVCVTETNREFRAKMTGELEALRKFVDDPSLVVGKKVTVKYFGLTKTGVPRFPVAVRIREDS